MTGPAGKCAEDSERPRKARHTAAEAGGLVPSQQPGVVGRVLPAASVLWPRLSSTGTEPPRESLAGTRVQGLGGQGAGHGWRELYSIHQDSFQPRLQALPERYPQCKPWEALLCVDSLNSPDGPETALTGVLRGQSSWSFSKAEKLMRSSTKMGKEAGAATVENSMEILKKLSIEVPYDPAIALLGRYLEKTLI